VCQKRHRECIECAGRQIGVFGITTRGRYLVNLSKICSVGCCCRGRVQRACCVEHNSCGGSYFIFIIRRLYDEIAFKYFEHPEGRGTRQLSTHTPALFCLLASTPLIRHLNALHLCCVCTYTFYRRRPALTTRTPFVSFPQGIMRLCIMYLCGRGQ
jgi:hypothetical protein